MLDRLAHNFSGEIIMKKLILIAITTFLSVVCSVSTMAHHSFAALKAWKILYRLPAKSLMSA